MACSDNGNSSAINGKTAAAPVYVSHVSPVWCTTTIGADHNNSQVQAGVQAGTVALVRELVSTLTLARISYPSYHIVSYHIVSYQIRSDQIRSTRDDANPHLPLLICSSYMLNCSRTYLAHDYVILPTLHIDNVAFFAI